MIYMKMKIRTMRKKNQININNNMSYDLDGEKYEETELNNIFKDLNISKDNKKKKKKKTILKSIL